MHNSSCSSGFLQFIGLETPTEPVPLSYHGGHIAKEEARAVMCLLRLSTFLGFFLVVLHFVTFLLAKLFSFLLQRAATSQEPRNSLQGVGDESGGTTGDDGRCFRRGELAAGTFCGDEGLLLLYNESSAVNDTLLVEEEKALTRRHLLEFDESFVAESPYGTPLNYDEHLLHLDQCVNTPVTDVVNPADLLPPAIIFEHGKDELEQQEEMEVEVPETERCVVIVHAHSESKKFEQEEVNEAFGGSLTGTGESSKSSVEWRNSAISVDSDTERPFSSSSRRSSNWETYSVFRKYDEEMMFLDRISSQKLAETESCRSIKFQPRSISQRITGTLSTVKKKTMSKKNRQGGDPYQELENAYVAQICLAWEALNWNYSNFQQRNVNSERFFCTAWVAQQFQQFQVLLQRFIENEPYESGGRPEVFARMRICFPKLLQVPELQNLEAEGSGGDSMISSAEFSGILEDAIRTFFNFLNADKKNPCQMLKALLLKGRSSSVDTSFLHLLKKANKKKKMRLKDMLNRSKHLESKWVSKGDEEMEILMGLIDMKIVSRTLRMSKISQEQLHWCEEKMTKVRVWGGKIQRDPSPLFALFIRSNISALV